MGEIICRYGFNGYQHDLFKLEKKYFKHLKEEHLLDQLQYLNPDEYLVHDGDENYHIDISKLLKDVDKFITSHCKVYHTLVQSYNQLLEL